MLLNKRTLSDSLKKAHLRVTENSLYEYSSYVLPTCLREASALRGGEVA